MIVIKNVAYINFIKAFRPVICLHSYLYFSLITVQIKWLLCLNHIHIFSNFSFFLQNSDICILTRPHYIFHSSSRPLQKLYLKWDSKVLLPVSAPPPQKKTKQNKKQCVCSVLCSDNKRGAGHWADTLFQKREHTRRTKMCKECPADRGSSTSLPP